MKKFIVFIVLFAASFNCFAMKAVVKPSEALDNIYFYADYSNGDTNARWAKNVGTITVTADRTANNATYTNSSGKEVITTANNVARLCYGYYDSTGYHAFDNGQRLLREEASTNLIKYGNVDSNVTNSGGTYSYSGTGIWSESAQNSFAATHTVDNDSPFESSNQKSIKFEITTDGTSAISDHQFKNNTTNNGFTIVSDHTYTLSFYVKTSDGDPVAFYFNKSGSPYTDYGATDLSVATIANTWVRYTKTFTVPTGLGTITDAQFKFSAAYRGLRSVWFCGLQLEEKKYASSYIPTVGSTITRNAETITYSSTIWDSTINTNGTIGVSYTPRCLISSASSSYNGILSISVDGSNIYKIGYGANSGSNMTFFCRGNGATNDITISFTELTKFAEYKYLVAYGSVSDINGYKIRSYINGVGTGYKTTFDSMVGSVTSISLECPSGYYDKIILVGEDLRVKNQIIKANNYL